MASSYGRMGSRELFYAQAGRIGAAKHFPLTATDNSAGSSRGNEEPARRGKGAPQTREFASSR